VSACPALPRRHPALDIPADPAQHQGAGPVVVEPHGIQSEVGSVTPQITIPECLLPVKQQVVHVPEPALPRGGLGRGRSGEGVRVDLSQREIPEGEPDAPAQFFLKTFDFPVRVPGIRAFVIAVLQDEAAGCRAADMINVVVQRRQARSAPVRHRTVRHGFRPVVRRARLAARLSRQFV